MTDTEKTKAIVRDFIDSLFTRGGSRGGRRMAPWTPAASLDAPPPAPSPGRARGFRPEQTPRGCAMARRRAPWRA
ncbi:MAG: hypothetical protein ACXVGC_06740 [Mycobacteriaceae bacterium]